MNSKNAYFKYFAALLMFGMNGIVASRIALTSYEIVFTRTLIGSLLLMAIYALTRQSVHRLQNKKHTLCLMVSGVAMGTSWMFLYEAYQRIGVGLASLAYYCGPVVVMILSPALFREKLTWPRMAGFLAVLLGMFGVNSLALREANTAVGLLCGILSAAMYAVMVIFNKKAKSITGLENSMWQLLAGFLTVNAKALGVGTRDYARRRSLAGARLAAAIGSCGVAAHDRDRLPKPSATRWRAASTKTRGTASGPAPGPAPEDGSRGPSGSGKNSSRRGIDARGVGWGARAG